MGYRYCSACAKYIQKKIFKSHLKKHESGELTGELAQEEDDNDLDTSKDEEDDELIIEDDVVIENDDTDNETSNIAPNKIYNCFDCNRMFMSAEAHANHLRDVHGGEGGSVVLKLPGNQEEDEDVPEDQLVIDDS